MRSSGRRSREPTRRCRHPSARHSSYSGTDPIGAAHLIPLPMAQLMDSTAILLIAHGSRHASANDDLHQLASRLSDRGDYPIVESCFLELAEPDIQAGGDRCVARGATRVLMVPYFLSAGVHLLRDLAAARDALRLRHPRVAFRLGRALGPDPLLERLVAERIGQLDAGGDDAPGPASSAEFDAPLEGVVPAVDPPASSASASSIDTNGSKE